MMNIEFPFRYNSRGCTAATDHETHIRNLIEQLLFTSPGERVNRPGFGSGLRQLVFSPLNEELAASVQFLVQGALQQWLGELIEVDAVEVEGEENRLQITVRYVLRSNQEQRVAKFSRGI